MSIGNHLSHQHLDQADQTQTLRFRHLWLIVLLLVVIALAITGLLVTTLSVVLMIFAGLLFGIFVHSISAWLSEKLPLGYHFWYGTTVLIILLGLAGGFYYLGSQIAERTSDLISQLQSSIESAQQRISQYEWAARYVPDQDELQSAITKSGSNMVPEVMKGVRWIGWAFTGAIVVLFVGFYAAYEAHLYRAGLVQLLPKSKRDRGREVLDKLHAALGRWIVGRLFSMAIIGIITAIGLWLLGVPLPVTLGALAAFFTFIPNVGPLLAALPQVLLALNVGTNVALYVIIFNLVLQGVESYIITPLIQKHEVSLPPIVTITAQLLMGVWLGVIGIMMAAPLVVVIMVLTQMIYIKDRLGDDHPGELTENV